MSQIYQCHSEAGHDQICLTESAIEGVLMEKLEELQLMMTRLEEIRQP